MPTETQVSTIDVFILLFFTLVVQTMDTFVVDILLPSMSSSLCLPGELFTPYVLAITSILCYVTFFYSTFCIISCCIFFIFCILKFILKHNDVVIYIFNLICFYIGEISLRRLIQYLLTCQLYLSTINTSRSKINKYNLKISKQYTFINARYIKSYRKC